MDAIQQRVLNEISEDELVAMTVDLVNFYESDRWGSSHWRLSRWAFSRAWDAGSASGS